MCPEIKKYIILGLLKIIIYINEKSNIKKICLLFVKLALLVCENVILYRFFFLLNNWYILYYIRNYIFIVFNFLKLRFFNGKYSTCIFFLKFHEIYRNSFWIIGERE